ncbi:MAG: M6 family metalloprotease domain-containing protein [Breznakibacter sp.]
MKQLFPIFFLLILFPALLLAVGADPNPITVTQPDGSTLQIRIRGDEWNRWTATMDGYQIVKNTAGYFVYGSVNGEGRVGPSSQRVSDVAARSKSEKEYLRKIKVGRLGYTSSVVEQNRLKAAQQYAATKVAKAGSAISGQFKYLVILANFSDTKTTYTQVQFNSMMNESNYNGTGSFRDYYLENSNGMFDVRSTVTAWVTLSKTHDYYGPDTRWGEFAYDAIKAAYASGIDFSEFDNDGDGIVDGIAIIHQGNGQEATANTNDIWSHSWNLLSANYSEAQLKFGSVMVDSYTAQPELNGRGSVISTIGVIAHEFAHVLGAYDFYDTDYEESGGEYDGTGYWDLMASGCYLGSPSGSVPAHHNPYTKLQFGWIEAKEYTEPQKVELLPVISSQKVVKISTPTANEYFLLENRQKTGFDSKLLNSGMLIYHVDDNYISKYGSSNELNASSHQAMYIKAANSDVNSAGCPFPGTTGAMEFHDRTTPSSLSWDSEKTQKSVTNIIVQGDVVEFDYMAFQDGLPENISGSMPQETMAKLTWQYNGNEPVKLLIVYSPDNEFGSPIIGTGYEVGDQLPDGGTVVYNSDSQISAYHEVEALDAHYFKIWVDKGTRYSAPLEVKVNGWREIEFFVGDENGSPVNIATVEADNWSGESDANGKVVIYGDFGSERLFRYVVRKGGYEEKWGVFEGGSAQTVSLGLEPVTQWNTEIRQVNIADKNVALTWEPVIDEDFSDYNAFATSINNWTFVDNDKLSTYGIEDYDFDNEGYTGAFIVFDGYADSLIDNGAAIESVFWPEFSGGHCI